MGETVYSHDGEEYGDYDTALFRAIDGPDEVKVGDTVTLFEGEAVTAMHQMFVNVDRLIEEIQERAMDDYDDYADRYLTDIEDASELETLIVDWLNKNAAAPTFYTVQNVREIQVVVQKMGDTQ
ncbi:MAG: hypothetical protein KDJ39_06130 [Gammaproteobacteria bacterium]|nr:hypothetical protein [Gammaproteobacteria bacterium]